MRSSGLLFLLLFSLSILGACATEPEKKPKFNNANFVNEMFEVDQGMPVREVKQQDFFYKHCTLEERRPFLGATEFSCNNGPFTN